MKSRPVGAELFHADRQTDGNDEANSRFSQFWGKRLKTRVTLLEAEGYVNMKLYQINGKKSI
jgi:hypothetical protein